MAAALSITPTNIFIRNFDAYFQRPEKRVAVNEGGSSSSKTFSILQVLDHIARYTTRKLVISVVSESLPHLKLGAIRDFKNILGDTFDDRRFNKTEQSYLYPNAIIEFFSADNSGKVHGPRRDILFLNEANNISYEIYEALSLRTREFEFVDYNPVSEFWVHQYLIGKPEVVYIHSTFLDALHVLPQSIVEKIEKMKERNPDSWRIYGLGLLGKAEGLVHPVWQKCKQIPEGGVRFYGLDFGYTNDPSCLTLNVVRGEDFFTRELLYERGLTNPQIAKRMEQLGLTKHYDEVFADSAEPKSIQEIRDYGFNVKPAPKGPDSVVNGIQLLNQYRQWVTEDSVNGIKELRNYRYIQDRDSRYTNKPMDDWNHFCDSRRYGAQGKLLDRGVDYEQAFKE